MWDNLTTATAISTLRSTGRRRWQINSMMQTSRPPSRRSRAALAENEAAIVADFAKVQGAPADIGGYFHTDDAKTAAVMQPSQTLNSILG